MRKAPAVAVGNFNSIAASKDTSNLLVNFLHMSWDEWQLLLQDKERFRHNDSDNPEYCFKLCPQIAHSWITSRGSGVNIEAQALSRSFLDAQKLTRIQQENELLINHVKSLFLAFRRETQTYSHAYTLNLLDQNGIILYNDSTLPRSYPAIVPAVGTIWNEQDVGTNVCSLAYQTKHSVLLPGVLHYSDIFEDLITAAAPIQNDSGQVVALLAYVQRLSARPWEEGYQTTGLQSLGVVAALAAAIESFIRRNEATETAGGKKNRGYVSGSRHTGGPATYYFSDLIGASEEWCQAVSLGRRYAVYNENILLTGESGTGKELFAQSIHNERNPSGPFIAVNCTALPKSLIESELFGYEEGSFTGASRRGQPGKIELAHGGTLFLDEIGDMPLEFQAILLRVLEDKHVMRIGGSRYQKVDFRLVAATNKNLEQLVADGKFREDLYFRLSVLDILLPPLRRRKKDSELLALHFLNKYSTKWGRKPPELSPEACTKILAYDWPGNVRQLEKAIVHAMATEESDVIRPHSLPEMVLVGRELPSTERATLRNIKWPSGSDYSLVSWEKAAIQEAMAASDNLIPLAADLLGVGKSTLYSKLREYGLK